MSDKCTYDRGEAKFAFWLNSKSNVVRRIDGVYLGKYTGNPLDKESVFIPRKTKIKEKAQ